MDATSLSLLSRLGRSSDDENWDHLVDLYRPLLVGWLRRHDVPTADINDLVQEVLMAVVSDVGRFEHPGRPGAFRGWLKSILVNRMRHYWRSRRRPAEMGAIDAEARLSQLEDPASDASRVWNREHDEHVMHRLLTLTKPHFAPDTWEAFRRVALDGCRPTDVARELGLSLNAVFLAKSRVLKRLRREAEGLVDSASQILPKD